MWPTLTTTPHSLSLSLSPSVGTTEVESLQNFKEWLDMFALMFCISLSLVKDLNGNQIYGLFDHMKKGEHHNFEAHLSGLRLWATQCQNANISAGKYFAVSPSGRGQIQFTHKMLGSLL